MLSIALHALEGCAHPVRHVAVHAVKHEFAEAEDRIERRPQLMTHVG